MCEKHDDPELRMESVRFALGNCGDIERYETTDALIDAAQNIYKYLKDGSVPKREVRKSG